MGAVEEQDTIQKISSQESDNFERLEAEEIAAVRAAEEELACEFFVLEHHLQEVRQDPRHEDHRE